MINFIDNIGEYFASNYFDDDFTKKAIDKSGYSADAMKLNGQKILALKPMYFALKQRFMENKLRVKDKVKLTNTFHTRVLSALGYDANRLRIGTAHSSYIVSWQPTAPDDNGDACFNSCRR